MKTDEKILVVPRLQLFKESDFQGFIPMNDFSSYELLIREQGQFLWRSEMEEDPTFKQIIPYLIFKNDGRYFLMHRHADASEQRLKGKATLGIGGHLREADMHHGSIETWAEREFNEEVNYAGGLKITPLGLINDDSNPVGRVHIGFVYLLDGASSEISIKSELKDGALYPLDQIVAQKDALESWSQLILPALAAITTAGS